MWPRIRTDRPPSLSWHRELVARQHIDRGVQYGLIALAFLLPFPELHNLLEYFFLALAALWLVLAWAAGGCPCAAPHWICPSCCSSGGF